MRCKVARPLAFLVILLSGAATARDALAISACTAAQIVASEGSSCPNSTAPCTINKNYEAATGCTFDFGTRTVTLSGTIDFQSNVITIKAGSFTVAASGKLLGLGDLSTAPRNNGGSVTIQTTGTFAVNNASNPGKIDVSANSSAGNITVIAGGAVTIAGRMTAKNLLSGAVGGYIDISTSAGNITTTSTAVVDASGGDLGAGGSVSLNADAGNVDLGAFVDVRGGGGGDFELFASGTVTVRDLDCSANGDADDGGSIDIESLGVGNIQLLGTIRSSGTPSGTDSGGGSGGDLYIDASFGNVTVAGDIIAEGAGPDGFGGSIEIISDFGSITQNLGADISAAGLGTFGAGGDISIDAAINFTSNGVLGASAGDSGGSIDVFGGRDIALNKRLDAAGINAGSYGGEIFVEAGGAANGKAKGTVTVLDKIDVGAGVCSLERGCGRGGSIELDGCDVTISATGQVLTRGPSGGSVDITSREQLRVQGGIVNSTKTDLTGLDGTNTFRHRIGKAPINTGTVSPTALTLPMATCTAVLTTVCLNPCPTCGNGVVEYPETCDNNNGTPVNCDGCSSVCQAESCNDNNGCTNDTCDPTLGCNNTPKNENASCNDNNVCNGTDVCHSGFCTSSGALDCNDNNVCTTDSCNPVSGCAHANNSLPCNDNLFCNGGDTCGGGTCSVHAGSPCTGPDGDGNCSESCNEAADNCTAPDPNGSSCNDGMFCNGADTCNAGVCSTHVGNPCPGPDGDGNCAESCNEATDNCTAPDPDGSSCTDGLFCTGADTCLAGLCNGHTGDPCPGADNDLNCSESCNEAADNCTAADPDGSSCPGGTCQLGMCNAPTTTTTTSTSTSTSSSTSTSTSVSTSSTTTVPTSTTSTTIPARCSAAPVTGCFSTGKASLQVKDNALDTKDAVKWSLKKSDGFDQATLGNPATSRVYSLCIYDETAGVPSLKATITIDPNANWASKDPKGYSYRDKLGSEDGVIKAALKTGITGKTAVSISAKGVNIPMPAPFSTSEFFNADTGVTAQLVNNQTATCWTSRFTLPKKNDPAQYKATTP